MGVSNEASAVTAPLRPLEDWFPEVLEVMQLKNGVTPGRGYQSITRKKRMLTKSCDGVDDVDLDDEEAADDKDDPLSDDEDACSPSGANAMGMRERDVESFTRLLGEALFEVAGEEVQEPQGPRVLGWRRPGFGESPMARFQEKQVQEGKAASQQMTWDKVRSKLNDAVRFGCRSEAVGEGDPSTTAAAAAGVASVLEAEMGGSGAVQALANLDEGIDALLEEEICSDEASWLDIRSDVKDVKNQVAHMIFAELIEEVVAEISDMWSA